jgi:hypothetical protein
MQLFFGVSGFSRLSPIQIHMTTKQAEGVWEAHTSSLSPLQALKSIPDPFEVLGFPDPWEIRTACPSESSEAEFDSGSDDGSLSSTSPRSPTFQEGCLPRDIPLVDWGATATFTGLTDNSLGLDFAPSQKRAEVRAVATSNPQARSLRAPSNHQDVHDRERSNLKCQAPRRHATPQSHVTASETLVVGCLQDICLRGSVNNAADPKVREHKIEVFSSLIREHRRPRRRARLLDRRSIHTEGSNQAGTMDLTTGSAPVNRRREPTMTMRSVRAPFMPRSLTSSRVHLSCALLSCPMRRRLATRRLSSCYTADRT